MTYKCLVCYYNGLDEQPYDTRGIQSDEICPCCGFQFGYDDDNKDKEIAYEEWRNKWVAQGYPWFSPSRKPPKNWNPKLQSEEGMANLKKIK